MSLKIGIVGLPNVGKSTLFNALTRSRGAQMANYPFCTIEPNVGIVTVPDTRLQALSNVVHPEKILPAIIEFVDIAGLVKGAAQGEGLGNKFLSHIRMCDAILEVVRIFENKDIQHVSEDIDPKNDREVIHTELILADLETLQRRLSEIEKKVRANQEKDVVQTRDLLKKIESGFDQGKMINEMGLNEHELGSLQDLHFLTAKPIMYATNVSEENLGTIDIEKLKTQLGLSSSSKIIPVSAKVEQELTELSDEDAEGFLQNIGLKESSLNILIRSAYDLLGLHTYFTAGVKEVRAWTIKKGWKGPQAAGVIHTDFEKGFIRAEICSWEDFVKLGGESKCREAGKLRSEGKEYVMKDGDVVHFLFS